MKKYYLVEKLDFYDRSWVVIRKFITKTPEKFKDSKTVRYMINEIELK